MVKIVYDDVAPDAIYNVNPAIGDLQPFCNLSDLKREHISVPKAATLEDNYFRLDGTFELFPDDTTTETWGVWSKSMSRADGVFNTPPVLSLTFTKLFSSVGLTFYFNEYEPNWCSRLNVKWYRDDTMLADLDFSPDSHEYSCIHEVQKYNKIVVTFYEMSKPYRYLKLKSALYGIVRTFLPGEFRALNLLQVASPISETLEINTMKVSLNSKTSVPYMFQKKQPLSVYHDENLQGVFYITKSDQSGERLYGIEASDLVDLLDKCEHFGGVYESITLGELVAEIVSPYPYEIEQGLEGIILPGWLPIASKRENLMQASFAARAIVDTSCSDRLRIYRASSTVKASFDEYSVFSGVRVEKSDLVTSVAVAEHKFTKSSESTELFNDTLNGAAELRFNDPVYDLAITGGEILESNANRAVIKGIGSVVLTGKKYTHATRIITKQRDDLGANDIQNVKTVKNATLVTAQNSADVVNAYFDYWAKRESVTAKIVLGDTMPGDVVTVDTAFGGKKTGVVKSISMNLARKRIGEAVIVGE